MSAALRVEGLRTTLESGGRIFDALRDVSFVLPAGKTLALVGESGSGKSLTALSIMGLLQTGAASVADGKAMLGDVDLLQAGERKMRKIRGDKISMIFQEPMTSLNPVMTLGEQIIEVLMEHREIDRKNARERAISLLERVRIADASARLEDYPHRLSGGMRQRVMIAMALACEPSVLIADEPTTALDVTIQAQILGLLSEIQERSGTAILLITHNLGVVAQTADNVAVMYAGRIVEYAPVRPLFLNPLHPYTVGLLASTPSLDPDSSEDRDRRLHEIPGIVPQLDALGDGCPFAPRCERAVERCWIERPELLEKRHNRKVACHLATEEIGLMAPVLEVSDLEVRFHSRKATIYAVDGVSFHVQAGETVGLVGESGCGKSSLGKAIVGLNRATAGSVRINGQECTNLSRRKMLPLRPFVQMVFQDPYSSLNPRLTVGSILEEPLSVHKRGSKAQRKEKIESLMDHVGLHRSASNRYPHEFSGGQRQRIGIARALALDPSLIICDEAVSALDVSIQAQVVNLLTDLQKERGLSYLFISHDLSVVRHIADRVLVMYLGRIVESGDRKSFWREPLHPYTRALLAAAPRPVPPVEKTPFIPPLAGEVASSASPPSGCRFRTRCKYAQAICTSVSPPLKDIGEGHSVACHFVDRQADGSLVFPA